AYTYYCQLKVNAVTYKFTTDGYCYDSRGHSATKFVTSSSLNTKALQNGMDKKFPLRGHSATKFVTSSSLNTKALQNDEHVTITSNDPLSGEERLKLIKLMELYTQLQSRVLTLELTKANQALKIGSLKRRVKKLEKKASKKTHKLKRLYKIGRMIADLDVDEGIALVNETQERNDQDMFDTSIFDDEEVVVEKKISTADPVTTIDYELAARLQEEEIGEMSIEEKSRLFVELMDIRKKHFARLRAKNIRKSVKGSEKAAEGSEKAEEGNFKRAASNLEEEDAKKQMIQSENEYVELKR
nr:hypothetical protein [Tanacetum cinerariifolium]